ncbi:Na(+)/H(+) antiporter subunit F1 [Psychrobacillus glaciei]|uniref:Na(+)/H(+) antiporter subunit F1 n=1 Tax=Psychrobacillus glaciei TaxID=2283160 RepID=A0A5J6SPD5_9BACI|nr:Na(+)/H(+) antiporter subunit F1 [Psychrobacillus glaciei]QFF99811.1 Na(+)/H(+) antiporter subunit F1 [Psychrobacillus glaciei]
MTTFLWVIVVLIGISLLGFLYRLVKGPTTPDRVIALDAIGVGIISLIGLISILFDTGYFLDVILLLAILSFIGTVAFSKFTEKGVIIQRDRNS